MSFTPYKSSASGFTPYKPSPSETTTPESTKKGGIFSSLARAIAKTPLKVAGGVQSAFEAGGQLLTGQGDKASETISKGSERMRKMEKNLGYEEGEISRPLRLAEDIKVKDGKMTGGNLGKETVKSIGAAAELASYGMGGPEASAALKGGFGTKAALGKLALQTGSREAISGAVGSAGASMGEGEMGWGTAGYGLAGAGAGFAGGFAAPYISRFASKSLDAIKGSKSWLTISDDAVEKALQAENKMDVSTPFMSRKAVKPDSGASTLLKPLSEIDDDIHPVRALDAVELPEPLRKKAISNGIKEGRINTISDMSQVEKREALQMMGMAETKEAHELAEHPMRVAAKPIVDQVSHLQAVRKKSGASLDPLMDAMPNVPVSLQKPTDAFHGWLEDRGVKIVFDDTGSAALDFSGSRFAGRNASDDRGTIQEIFNELLPSQSKGAVISRTPKEIRVMRQRLFDTLDKNTKGTDVFSNETTGLLKNIRHQLLEPLEDPSVDVSGGFAKANKEFAISTDKLEKVFKYLGKDFIGKEDEAITGRVAEILPRLISNTGERPGAVLRELADGAAQTGMDPALIRDPRRQILFAEMMDDLYDIKRPRSLGGEMDRAIEKGSEGLRVAGMAARKDLIGLGEYVVEKISGPKQLKQRQIIKDLLNEGLEAYESPLMKSVVKEVTPEISDFPMYEVVEPVVKKVKNSKTKQTLR